MNNPITLADVGLILIGAALIVLIIYCIILVKNLVPAVKTLNRILENAESVTNIAAGGALEAQKIIADVSQSVSSVSASFKGKESFFQGVTSLVKAVTSFIGILKNKGLNND
jgi:uncharacterized protein YoxC